MTQAIIQRNLNEYFYKWIYNNLLINNEYKIIFRGARHL